jgi:hypothetical protein
MTQADSETIQADAAFMTGATVAIAILRAEGVVSQVEAVFTNH